MARIQVSSPNVGCQITVNDRVTSNGSSFLIRSTRDRTFPLLGSGFRLSAVDISSAQTMQKIREAISVGWAKQECVLIGRIRIYIYISNFKCKLIDSPTVHVREWQWFIASYFFLHYLRTKVREIIRAPIIWIWRLEGKNVHFFQNKRNVNIVVSDYRLNFIRDV